MPGLYLGERPPQIKDAKRLLEATRAVLERVESPSMRIIIDVNQADAQEGHDRPECFWSLSFDGQSFAHASGHAPSKEDALELVSVVLRQSADNRRLRRKAGR